MFTWFSKIIDSFAPVRRAPSGPVRSRLPSATGPVPLDPYKPSAPGIRYDATLIGKFKDDHRVLLKSYGTIKAAAECGDWLAVEVALLPFRSGLTDHLMTESIKLYVYLQLTLTADRERLSLMRKFSAEMVGIGKVVLAFVDEHRDVSHHPEKQARFLETWSSIGKTLGDRIAREEQTLYPMYDLNHSNVQ